MTSTDHSRSFLILAIILGAIIGAVGVSIRIAPDIEQYQHQIALLTSDIEATRSTLTSMNLSLHDTHSSLSTLANTLSETQSTLASMNHSLHDAQATLANVNDEKVSLATDLTQTQNEVIALQARIDDILTITVTQHYIWEYDYDDWLWDLSLPLDLYVTYWERPRPTSWASWSDMAHDSADDAYFAEMAHTIDDTAREAGFTEQETVNYVISFVQSLPYAADNVSAPGNDYPKYPLETLFERGGDCEDTSILVAALLDQMGFDVALLILYNANHCAVGIAIDASGSYYEYEGKEYYYLETTGEGWHLGEIPPELEDTRANIYPIAD
jgi:predicted transglutaminase-like cysteine proteinase